MSVTFWSPQAPKIFIPEKCMCFEDGKPDDNCIFCKGEGIYRICESEKEFNLSNGNAQAFLEMLGFTDPEAYLGGELLMRDYSSIRQKIVGLKNKKGAKEASAVPASQEGNFYSFGRSVEQIERYLDMFESLVIAAQENEWATVNWA